MPGPEIKNWDMYHAIKKEVGGDKTKAAKIANAQAKKKKKHPKKQAIENLIKKNR